MKNPVSFAGWRCSRGSFPRDIAPFTLVQVKELTKCGGTTAALNQRLLATS